MSPAAQTTPVQGITLAQAAQGGLIDDIDVEVVDAAFCEWDYNGNIDHNILALGVQYQDQNGKTYDQYYSAGELTYFVPSPDGSMAVPVADKQMLADSCNAWKFLASLLEVGFPEDQLAAGDIKCIVGLQCHVKQIAQPKRQGLIRGGKNADREQTVLLVSEIHALPGQPKKAGIAGAGKPVGVRPTAGTPKPGLAKPAPTAVGKSPTTTSTGKPGLAKSATPSPSSGKVNGQAGASTTTAGDDDKAVAAELLTGILVEAGGSVTKKDLAKLAFQAAGAKVTEGVIDAKQKAKLVQLCFQDSFLHELAEGGAIAFDGATVSLAA